MEIGGRQHPAGGSEHSAGGWQCLRRQTTRLIRRPLSSNRRHAARWSSSQRNPSLLSPARPCGARHFHGRQRRSVNLRLPTVAAAGWPHHSNTVPTPATATILVQSDVERVSERPIVLQEGRVGAARGRRLGGGTGSRQAAQRRSARAARAYLRFASALRPLQAAATLRSAEPGPYLWAAVGRLVLRCPAVWRGATSPERRGGVSEREEREI